MLEWPQTHGVSTFMNGSAVHPNCSHELDEIIGPVGLEVLGSIVGKALNGD